MWDFADTDASNHNMADLYFMVNAMKNYFCHPTSYNIFINVNPIIKALMRPVIRLFPEEDRNRVKLLSKREIFEWISGENIPDFLGGNSDYDYRIIPANAVCLRDLALKRGIDAKSVEQFFSKFTDYL